MTERPVPSYPKTLPPEEGRFPYADLSVGEDYTRTYNWIGELGRRRFFKTPTAQLDTVVTSTLSGHYTPTRLQNDSSFNQLVNIGTMWDVNHTGKPSMFAAEMGVRATTAMMIINGNMTPFSDRHNVFGSDIQKFKEMELDDVRTFGLRAWKSAMQSHKNFTKLINVLDQTLGKIRSEEQGGKPTRLLILDDELQKAGMMVPYIFLVHGHLWDDYVLQQEKESRQAEQAE